MGPTSRESIMKSNTYMIQKRIAGRKKMVISSIFALVFLVGVLSTAAFTVSAASATLKLKPDKGNVNRSETVTGSGFPDSATVTIKFGTTVVAMTTSSSSGAVSTTFKVPQATAGNKTVTAMVGKTVEATTTFTVVSHFSLKPTKGKEGRTVNGTGAGFAALSTVTVTFNGVSIGTEKSNSTGGFGITFTVPDDAAGAYSVVATDASGNSGTATFTIN
jgi:hypothetical protein